MLRFVALSCFSLINISVFQHDVSPGIAELTSNSQLEAKLFFCWQDCETYQISNIHAMLLVEGNKLKSVIRWQADQILVNTPARVDLTYQCGSYESQGSHLGWTVSDRDSIRLWLHVWILLNTMTRPKTECASFIPNGYSSMGEYTTRNLYRNFLQLFVTMNFPTVNRTYQQVQSVAISMSASVDILMKTYRKTYPLWSFECNWRSKM